MVRIKNKILSIPIIQGGMGVGVSLGNLAGNVAACGGMGVISTVNAGFGEPDFDRQPMAANLRAISNEIRKAVSIAKGKGLIAINTMVEVKHYEELVKAAVKEGIDAVISGAGLPLRLPEFTKGTDTAAAPIVSSGKAIRLICKTWDRHYEVAPDFVVIEGAKAGGHLGFSREKLEEKTTQSLDEILGDVLAELIPFEEKYGRKIPVFAAGGVFDGKDMAKMTDLGASGVQIATRFIATEECDAHIEFKNVILEAKEEDTLIIKSPVGMPARAIRTTLIKNLENGKSFSPKICNDCLEHCPKGKNTPYCISRALIAAVTGNLEEGLFFCGSNVGKITEMMTVKELMQNLVTEWKKWRKEA